MDGAKQHRGMALALVPWLVLLAGLAVGGGGVEVPALLAQEVERRYGINGFRVELELAPEGHYRITESIDFVYEGGTYSQGFRTIPTRGLDAVRDVQVSSPQIEVGEVEVRERGRSVEITWDFEPRGEPTTFVIEYRVEGALQEVEGWNRIAWDAVGDAWEVPVRGLDVRLRWPHFGLDQGEVLFVPEEEGRLGRWDGSGDVEGGDAPPVDGWEVRFSLDSLEARTPYGVQAAFPVRLPGRAPPEPRRDPLVLILLGFAGAVAGLIPGLTLMLKWRDPGDPPTRIPDGMPQVSLPWVGFLSVGSTTWGLRTATALLVDLARRGHVTLERTEAKGEQGATTAGGGLAPGKLLVHRVDPHPEGDPLSPVEVEFLEAVAERDTFQEFLGRSRWIWGGGYRRTQADLVDADLVERHPERKWSAIAGSILLPVIMALAAFLVPSVELTAVLIGALIMVAVGLGISAAEGAHQLSEKGARLRAWIRARHDDLRTDLETKVESDPEGGARLLADHLPFLLLDPKVSAKLLTRLEKAVGEAGGELELPAWIRRATGGSLTGTGQDDDLLAFLFFLWITQGSQPGMQASAGAGSGFSGGGFSGGAGVSTGVGGGGGGMR